MFRGYLRLVMFAVGLLAGVQVPGFVDQYAKRVSAHYLEAERNFSGFQRAADEFFGGSVEALIAHHATSADPAFRDEGKTIEAIYGRLRGLAAELDALRGPLPARIAHVAWHPNREILEETVAAYSYTVPLDPSAILSGVTSGFLLSFLVECLAVGTVGGLGRVFTLASTRRRAYRGRQPADV